MLKFSMLSMALRSALAVPFAISLSACSGQPSGDDQPTAAGIVQSSSLNSGFKVQTKHWWQLGLGQQEPAQSAITIDPPPRILNTENTQDFTLSGTCIPDGSEIYLSAQSASGPSSASQTTCARGKWKGALGVESMNNGHIYFTAMLRHTERGYDLIERATAYKYFVLPKISLHTAALDITLQTGTIRQLRGKCDAPGGQIFIGKQAVSACQAGAFSFNHDFKSYPDGEHLIPVILEGHYGNRSSASLTLTKKTVAPKIAITSANPAYINIKSGTLIKIAGKCEAEGRPVTIKADGTASAVCKNGAFQLEYDFASAREGENQFKLEHADAKRNTTIVSLKVIKDTVAPRLSLANPVLQNRQLVINIKSGKRIELLGTCTDNSAFLTLSGILRGSSPCRDQKWSMSADLSALPQGLNRSSILIRDPSGNETELPFWVNVDTVAPVLKVVSPAANDYINLAVVRQVRITGSCSEPGSGIAVESPVRGAAICSNANDWQMTLNLSSASEGPIALGLRITDKVGNETTSSHSLIKDTIAPEVKLLTVSPITSLNATAILAAGKCSEDGEVKILAGSVSEGVVCEKGRFESLLNLSRLPVGAVAIRAEQLDRARNLGSAVKNAVKASATVQCDFMISKPSEFPAQPRASDTYCLANDIDFAGSAGPGRGTALRLNGQGFAIRNAAVGAQGFFGIVISADISNIVFDNIGVNPASVSSASALIVHQASNSRFSNITIKTRKTIVLGARGYSGLFAGYLSASELSNIVVSVSDVELNGANAGGVIGYSAQTKGIHGVYLSLRRIDFKAASNAVSGGLFARIDGPGHFKNLEFRSKDIVKLNSPNCTFGGMAGLLTGAEGHSVDGVQVSGQLQSQGCWYIAGFAVHSRNTTLLNADVELELHATPSSRSPSHYIHFAGLVWNSTSMAVRDADVSVKARVQSSSTNPMIFLAGLIGSSFGGSSMSVERVKIASEFEVGVQNTNWASVYVGALAYATKPTDFYTDIDSETKITVNAPVRPTLSVAVSNGSARFSGSKNIRGTVNGAFQSY